MKQFIRICIVSACFLSWGVAHAQWERLPGPTAPEFGGMAGSVTCIATNDTFVWIGTEKSGVFRAQAGLSFNSWEVKNKGISSYTIFSLDYASGQLVATTDRGVYTSSNNGDVWVPSTNGLPLNQKITAFTAGNGVFLAATEKYGVFRSLDNGFKWEPANNGLLDNNILDVKAGGNTFWALTLNAGLFSSSDGGASWQAVTVPGGCTECKSLEIVDSAIFIPKGNLLLSRNGGKNWTTDTTVKNIKGIAAHHGRLIAWNDYTVYESADTGKQWVFDWEFNIDSSMRINTALATPEEIKFIGTKNHGLYRGTIAAITWKPYNLGLLTGDITQLEHHTTQLYALTFGSIYRSGDNGINWLDVGPYVNSPVTSFVWSGNTILAGTDTAGVLTANSQMNWQYANNGLGDKRIVKLVQAGNTVFALTKNGIYRSPDNGQIWVKYCNAIDTLFFTDILFDGNILYAGTNKGFYKSVNDGNSFELVQPSFVPQRYVYFIRKINGKLWMKVGIDTHVSSDGLDWPRHYYVGGVTFANAMSVVDNRMFASANTGYFFKDTAADTWNYMKAIEGLETNVFAVNDSFIFAGTGAGVWRLPEGQVITSTKKGGAETLVKIYPNPAQNLLFIEPLNATFSTITISDILGKVLYSAPFSTTINISGLQNGIYFITLRGENQTFSRKITVVK